MAPSFFDVEDDRLSHILHMISKLRLDVLTHLLITCYFDDLKADLKILTLPALLCLHLAEKYFSRQANVSLLRYLNLPSISELKICSSERLTRLYWPVTSSGNQSDFCQRITKLALEIFEHMTVDPQPIAYFVSLRHLVILFGDTFCHSTVLSLVLHRPTIFLMPMPKVVLCYYHFFGLSI